MRVSRKLALCLSQKKALNVNNRFNLVSSIFGNRPRKIDGVNAKKGLAVTDNTRSS